MPLVFQENFCSIPVCITFGIRSQVRHTHTYTHTRQNTQKQTNTHKKPHTYVLTHTLTHTHTHTHKHTHTQTRTHIHTRTHTLTWPMRTVLYTCLVQPQSGNCNRRQPWYWTCYCARAVGPRWFPYRDCLP